MIVLGPLRRLSLESLPAGIIRRYHGLAGGGSIFGGLGATELIADESAGEVPYDEFRAIILAKLEHLQELYAGDEDDDEDSSDEDSDSEEDANAVLRKERAVQLETHSKTIRIFRIRETFANSLGRLRTWWVTNSSRPTTPRSRASP